MMKFNTGLNLSSRPNKASRITIIEPPAAPLISRKRQSKAVITVKNIVLNQDINESQASMTEIIDGAKTAEPIFVPEIICLSPTDSIVK